MKQNKTAKCLDISATGAGSGPHHIYIYIHIHIKREEVQRGFGNSRQIVYCTIYHVVMVQEEKQGGES
jgi:hypothetical protein